MNLKLQPRQRQVADLMMTGKTNKEIGRVLAICEKTVKAHCTAIFKKAQVRNRTEFLAMTVATGDKTWRCFHCDEVFTDREKAALHFGVYQTSDPACQINIEAYRKMEENHRAHLQEDSEMHRELAAMECKTQIELRRAEERGYARGIEDMKQPLAI